MSSSRPQPSALALILALGGATGEALQAQGAPPAGARPLSSPLRVGERVRFRIADSTAPETRRRCEGRVAGLAGDTVVIAEAYRCPSGRVDALPPLRVARGDRGSRVGHTLLGMLGGAALGALAGAAYAGDGCRGPGCAPADGAFAAAVVTTVWGAAGALVGGVVGLVRPAGPRWVAVDGVPPLRVTTTGGAGGGTAAGTQLSGAAPAQSQRSTEASVTIAK